MIYTARELELLNRMARKAAGVAEPKTALDLAQDYLADCITMIGSIAKTCADPKLRFEASKHIVALNEDARKAREAAEDKHFNGNAEIANALLILPLDRRRDALAQMLFDNQISKSDYDTLIKGLNAELETANAALLAEATRLVRIIEGVEPTKLINGNATGAINGHVN